MTQQEQEMAHHMVFVVFELSSSPEEGDPIIGVFQNGPRGGADACTAALAATGGKETDDLPDPDEQGFMNFLGKGKHVKVGQYLIQTTARQPLGWVEKVKGFWEFWFS